MPSFNLSRFLLRVRIFWTRERLVPVMGITALFLFGLLFSQYISRFFEAKPVVAEVLLAAPHTPKVSPPDAPPMPGHLELHLRHLEEMDRLELGHEREHLERLRRELERHREQLDKHRKFIIKNGDGAHEIYVEEDGEKKSFIFRNKVDEDIRIEVNGEVVKIDRIEEQI